MLESDNKQRFSFRKLSIGLASVLIGISFFGANQTVKADTVDSAEQSAQVAQNADKPVQNNADTQTQQNTSKELAKRTDVHTQQNASNALTKQTESTDIQKQPEEQGQDNNPVTQSNTENQNTQTFNLIKIEKPQKSKVNVALAENKIAEASISDGDGAKPKMQANGGFDEATWGKMDMSKWTGQINKDGIYELTDYTGDLEHIIVPNATDFTSADLKIDQVGISADLTHSWFEKGDPKTIAFSKDSAENGSDKVIALGDDWTSAFTGHTDRKGAVINKNSNLNKIDLSNLDTSNVDNTAYMFYNDKLDDLSSLSNWDTHQFKVINGMFYGNKLSDLTPIANWDMHAVEGMNYVFFNNQITDVAPISNWNIGQVEDFSGLFQSNKIQDISSLSKWNVKNVKYMNYMFFNNQINNITGLDKWDTSNLTTTSYMFYNNQISDLTPFSAWKMDKLTDTSAMFQSNHITDLAPLKNWTTDHVQNFAYMFYNNQISDLTPISNWKTDNSQDFNNMFNTNLISDLSSISNWNVSKGTNFSSMFANNKIANLEPLSSWKVDNAQNLSYMFTNNKITSLAGLESWNASNATNMSYMFQNNKISNLTPLSNWSTDKLTDTRNMFQNNSINDISALKNWNMSKVTNAEYMFMDNQISNLTSLENWNTSSLVNVSEMFRNNKISDLTPAANWNTKNIQDFSAMFMANPVKIADFTKWDFSSAKELGYLINSSVHSVIFVKDQATRDLLNKQSHVPDWGQTDTYPTIYAPINNLTFNQELHGMPTIFIATDVNRQAVLNEVNKLVEYYQNENPNYDVTPVVDLSQLTDLADLANARFTTKLKRIDITIHFIDDTNSNYAPDDLTLNDQEVTDIINTDMIPRDGLNNYNFVYGIYTIDLNNPNWDVHVTHKTSKTPEYNPSTRTIKITYPDGTSEIIVQTIGYVHNRVHDLVINNANLDTYEDYTVDDAKSHLTINKVDQGSLSYVKQGDQYFFAPYALRKIPGYKAKMKLVPNIQAGIAMYTVSFIALPNINNTNKQEPVKPSEPEKQDKPSEKIYAIDTNKQISNDLIMDNTVKLQDILDNKPEINKSSIKIHKAGSNYVEFSYINKPSAIFTLFKENGKYYLLVNNKKYTITSFKQLVSTINHYLLNSLSSNA